MKLCFEQHSSEEFRAVEVWRREADLGPADVVGCAAVVSALVEVASERFRSLVKSEELEWNHLHDPPLLARAFKVDRLMQLVEKGGGRSHALLF